MYWVSNFMKKATGFSLKHRFILLFKKGRWFSDPLDNVEVFVKVIGDTAFILKEREKSNPKKTYELKDKWYA